MDMNILIQLRNNPLLDHYLKYHSYWYKWLLRDSSLIKEMENEMKKEYKLINFLKYRITNNENKTRKIFCFT